ncbi:hypothetical protein FA15DRAFT_580325 [Coprinopsis marcescibilis]|uniref:DUF1740-domain-containing protein n=1 Tax=Coprinopsis marcescibilis TaxID=230819 RepID=A0A5C3LDB7_COPMA|nr:hypothetical protein FA15DRAFT_580325 [Coprinopsis marcescibilis]
MSVQVPSFASFPDFEGESSKKENSESVGKERDRDSSREKKKKDKDRSSKRQRSRSPTSRDKHENEDKEKRRKRDKDRHSHGHREDSKRRRKEDRRTNSEATDTIPKLAEDDSYRLFFADRKPDVLNAQYGGLHQGDIPRYKMVAGGRRVLGLSPAFVVVRRLGKGIEIGLKNSIRLSSIEDSKARSVLALAPTRRLLGGEPSDKYQEVDGFIRLPSNKSKATPEDSYRSILSKDDSSSESDEFGYDSEEDEDSQEENPPETSQQANLRALEQRLANEPESVHTWISLLDLTLSTVPIASKNATKARCDIALSVLSRALAAHPTNNLSKVLWIKYLKAGEEIWPQRQLLEQWEKALKVGGVEIWMEWLEWRLRQTNEGFSAFIDAANRALNAFGESEDDQIAKLRIFWRTAVAVRDAGYSERAFAMLQAQAELVSSLPNTLINSSFNHQLDELEEFWESETSRIGEDGAKGWNWWYSNGKPQAEDSQHKPNDTLEVADLDLYRQWSNHERESDRTMLLPTHTTADPEELDPYSAVLFADIRPILVNIPSPHAGKAFRIAFLSFVGLHLPGFSQTLSSREEINWDDRWNLGTFASTEHLQAIFPSNPQGAASLSESVGGVTVGREKEYNDAFGPVKHWGFGLFHPLDIHLRRDQPREARLWTSVDVSGLNPHLVRRLFSQLRTSNDDSFWDSLALAFEAALSIKNALKLSKAFLSSPKSTLEYWVTHAQLERLNGRLDGARKVYQTILIASKPAPQQGLSRLWWNWAEMEWLAGQGEQAMNVVLQSAGITKPSQIGILRAKNALQEALSTASNALDEEYWFKLSVLLELLNSERIDGALNMLDERIRQTQGTLARERVLVDSLLFIYHYRAVLNNPMPPSILREHAERALQEFPNNSVILGVFLEAEKGHGVWGKVKDMLRSGQSEQRDVVRCIEDVWVAGWEKGRWGTEIEKTRSGLAAAVQQERTRGSPIVWRVYLEFEIRAGQLKTAKKLLFRAIGECPFAKELYLLAFNALRSVFDTRELHSLADLMAERGLRLRRGLDEVVAVVDHDADLEAHSEDVVDDEIEINAQELRRLKPY